MNRSGDDSNNTLSVFGTPGGSMEVSFRSKRRVEGRFGSSLPLTTPERHPYRIHFSITEKSRSWMRASRRSIRWVFGLALRQGESWKVEEQAVILTWSTKSGKIKSVKWNKYEIMHLVRFREHGLIAGTLECSWRLRTGELVQILVHSGAQSERERYTLNVDGEEFAHFPTIRQLERDERHYEYFEDQIALIEPCEDINRSFSSHKIHHDESLVGSAGPSDAVSDTPSLSGQYRLSMAGLSKVEFSCGDQAIQDELHSDLYSPQLDILRQTITEALPQAEPIISRAIAHAFCAETGSMTSCDSLSAYSIEGGCPSALEASVLRGAYEWTRSHRSANEDEQLHFLQKLIDELLMHFRNENIDSDETSRIVLEAAILLGLELEDDSNLPSDTILVHDIPKSLNEEDMIVRLQQKYGDIRTAAIAPFSGVGFARFEKTADARRAVNGPQDRLLPNLLLISPKSNISKEITSSPKYVFEEGGFPSSQPKPQQKSPFRLQSFGSSTTLDLTEQTSDTDDTTTT